MLKVSKYLVDKAREIAKKAKKDDNFKNASEYFQSLNLVKKSNEDIKKVCDLIANREGALLKIPHGLNRETMAKKVDEKFNQEVGDILSKYLEAYATLKQFPKYQSPVEDLNKILGLFFVRERNDSEELFKAIDDKDAHIAQSHELEVPFDDINREIQPNENVDLGFLYGGIQDDINSLERTIAHNAKILPNHGEDDLRTNLLKEQLANLEKKDLNVKGNTYQERRINEINSIIDNDMPKFMEQRNELAKQIAKAKMANEVHNIVDVDYLHITDGAGALRYDKIYEIDEDNKRLRKEMRYANTTLMNKYFNRLLDEEKQRNIDKKQDIENDYNNMINDLDAFMEFKKQADKNRVKKDDIGAMEDKLEKYDQFIKSYFGSLKEEAANLHKELDNSIDPDEEVNEFEEKIYNEKAKAKNEAADAAKNDIKIAKELKDKFVKGFEGFKNRMNALDDKYIKLAEDQTKKAEEDYREAQAKHDKEFNEAQEKLAKENADKFINKFEENLKNNIAALDKQFQDEKDEKARLEEQKRKDEEAKIIEAKKAEYDRVHKVTITFKNESLDSRASNAYKQYSQDYNNNKANYKNFMDYIDNKTSYLSAETVNHSNANERAQANRNNVDGVMGMYMMAKNMHENRPWYFKLFNFIGYLYEGYKIGKIPDQVSNQVSKAQMDEIYENAKNDHLFDRDELLAQNDLEEQERLETEDLHKDLEKSENLDKSNVEVEPFKDKQLDKGEKTINIDD